MAPPHCSLQLREDTLGLRAFCRSLTLKRTKEEGIDDASQQLEFSGLLLECNANKDKVFDDAATPLVMHGRGHAMLHVFCWRQRCPCCSKNLLFQGSFYLLSCKNQGTLFPTWNRRMPQSKPLQPSSHLDSDSRQPFKEP